MNFAGAYVLLLFLLLPSLASSRSTVQEELAHFLNLEDAFPQKGMILNNLKEENKPEVIVPLLRNALNDKNPKVRACAAWALGEFRDAESTTKIIAVFEQEKDLENRSRIYYGLQLLGGKETIELLKRIFVTSPTKYDDKLRAEILSTLQMIRQHGSSKEPAMLSDPEFIHLMAQLYPKSSARNLEYIGWLITGHREAVNALMPELMKDINGSDTERAIVALRLLGDHIQTSNLPEQDILRDLLSAYKKTRSPEIKEGFAALFTGAGTKTKFLFNEFKSIFDTGDDTDRKVAVSVFETCGDNRAASQIAQVFDVPFDPIKNNPEQRKDLLVDSITALSRMHAPHDLYSVRAGTALGTLAKKYGHEAKWIDPLSFLKEFKEKAGEPFEKAFHDAFFKKDPISSSARSPTDVDVNACEMTCTVVDKINEWSKSDFQKKHDYSWDGEFTDNGWEYATVSLAKLFVTKAAPYCKNADQYVTTHLITPESSELVRNARKAIKSLLPENSLVMYGDTFTALRYRELLRRNDLSEKTRDQLQMALSQTEQSLGSLSAQFKMKLFIGGSIYHAHAVSTFSLGTSSPSDEIIKTFKLTREKSKDPCIVPYSADPKRVPTFENMTEEKKKEAVEQARCEAAARAVPFNLVLLTSEPDNKTRRDDMIAALKNFIKYSPQLRIQAAGSGVHSHLVCEIAPYYYFPTIPYATSAINYLLKDSNEKMKAELMDMRNQLKEQLFNSVQQNGLFRSHAAHSAASYVNPLAGLALIPLIEGCAVDGKIKKYSPSLGILDSDIIRLTSPKNYPVSPHINDSVVHNSNNQHYPRVESRDGY